MKKNYKKYSLKEKKKYYSSIFDKQITLKSSRKKYNKYKLDYSYGFLQGCTSGMSKKFNELSRSKKFGMIAGVKSRLKENK